jgi:5'-methylthioadenosine phosphorylase
MGVLGVVGGHSILGVGADAPFPGRARRRPAHGAAGPVTILDAGEFVVLQRHGLDEYAPAHLVDPARNLMALVAVGCDRVLALSSVGSLRADLVVGTHLVPDDFIALDRPPTSIHLDERCHVVPGFTRAWRTEVLGSWQAADDGPVVDGGVYWQANGPRFETPAEIRLLAGFADVVGMTVGSECAAANELGLDYAAVCVVDNLANGLDRQRLTPEQFVEGKRANQERLVTVLADVVGRLVA